MALVSILSLVSAFLGAQDCPAHAQPLRQLDRIDGAVGTTWISADLRSALGIEGSGEVLLVSSGETNTVQWIDDKNVAQKIERLANLQWPIAMASDEEALLVAERGAGRISIYHGSTQFTLGEGVLRTPSAVAASGTLVAVADDGLGEVLIFDLAAPNNAIVARHSGTRPAGVAFDELGNLWWSDAAQHRLHCVADLGRGATKHFGERGSFPGQYTEPRALFARGGCVFVADHLNHRIAIVDAKSGAFIGYWGMHAVVPRQGDGRIHYPDSIALNHDGSIAAIAEGFEDRVQLFTTGGDAWVDDGLGSGKGAVSSHFGSESACGGDLLALHEPETGAVILFDTASVPPYNVATVGASGASPGRYPSVSALGVMPGMSNFVIADESRGLLDIWSCAIDRTKPLFWDAFGARLMRSLDLTKFRYDDGSKPARVPRIVDIHIDSAWIYALDAANLEILVFTNTLAYSLRIPLPKDAREAVEFCRIGEEFVIVDPASACLWVGGDSRDGDQWRKVTALHSDDGEIPFVRPMGVCATASGALVVSDSARDQAFLCAPSSATSTTIARVIGERGELDEQFWLPLSCAPLGDGFMVVDRGNHRFELFNAQGEWTLTTSLGRFYTRKRTPATDTTGNES